MANYKIVFFGWCREAQHDKVWGFVEVGYDRLLYNFWGRRGGRYTFKEYGRRSIYDWDIERMIEKKTREGRGNGTYMKVPESSIETVAPGFGEEFEHQFTLCKLFDKFHGKQTA